MKRWAMLWLITTLPLVAETGAKVPLYRVTVVDSTTVAVNYGDRQMPTRIGFRGTVLRHQAKGDAQVRSRTGATLIEAKVENLAEPQEYGPQYLTYVLWAITPEGRVTNLGQMLPNHKNKASLTASTPLQTFGMFVTAEPHHAVQEPSAVVVAENALLPETVGKVETVRPREQFLRRAEVTVDTGAPAAPTTGRAVSRSEYEALVEIYQAQNALYGAESSGAHDQAREVYQRARNLLEEARKHYAARSWKMAVASARESTQTAEDARRLVKQAAVSGQ